MLYFICKFKVLSSVSLAYRRSASIQKSRPKLIIYLQYLAGPPLLRWYVSVCICEAVVSQTTVSFVSEILMINEKNPSYLSAACCRSVECLILHTDSERFLQ